MLDFIASIQQNKSSDFVNFYRRVDMLLLDDVQFFVGKEQTQEQFFHLFNDLYQKEKQIILTTDRHPRKLVGLQERLVSRFQSGLIADIQPPDLETRIAIIMNEAKHGGIDIDYSIVEFIANSVTKDIRVMKSLLVRLQAISALKNIDIDIDLCKTVIKENLGDVKLQSVSFVQILSYIAKTQNINKRKIVGKTRNQETVMARQIVMFLTRSLTNLSLKNIGRELGGRDHSTVIHSCNLVENKIKNNSSFRKKMEKIIDDLKKTGL
jgi:chromosomal replication initiator protein